MAPPIHPPTPAALSTQEETLGSVLADLRLAMGLSQRELITQAFRSSNSTGLVVSAATHWERDRRVPSPAHLLTLLHVLLPKGEPERTSTFRRVLTAASRSSSAYGPSCELVSSGVWTYEQWGDWAASVRRSG